MKPYRLLSACLTVFLLSSISLKGQQPVLSAANNECSGASNIVYAVPFPDNNTGATQSLPANICNGFVTPGPAKDVWFKFTYSTNMDSIVVDPGPDPNADIVTELFSGNCGNLVNITCSNFAEQNSNNQSEGFYLGALGLNPGTEYYFRVYGSNGIETSFTVLAKTATNLPPPANDECSTAQQLSPGQAIGGSSIGATQSLAPVTCNGFTSNSAKDVWFRFQKIPQIQSLLLFPESTDLVLELRSGCSGNSLSISCSDVPGTTGTEQVNLSGLSNGTIYYARVYGRDGTGGNFSIKLTSPPVNDNCSTASELIPNVQINGKTVDASQSDGPSAVCGGTPDDDVWYFFTMPDNADSVVLNPVFAFDPVIELRTSPCSASVAISCSHTGGKVKLPLSDLTVGTKYYIRVYSHNNSQGNFSIKLFQGSGQNPANDQCSNPQATNPSIGVSTAGNNNGATQSFGGVPCGGLGSASVKDVWYSFTRTPERDTLFIDGLGILDVLADIRSACSPDSLKACIDLEGTGEKKLDLSDVPEGSNCLLRVYGRNGSTGDFSFRFAENGFIPNPPSNNDCFSAQLLTVGNSCNSIAGTNISADATAGLSLPACVSGNSASAKDVWYRFVANGTKMMVKLTCDSGFDGALEILRGSCFGPQSVDCANNFPAGNDPDFPVSEEIFLNGLTSGAQYFIRVFGNIGTTGNFSVCVYNPNCNSTSANLQVNASEILSNEAVSTTLSNAQGILTYQLAQGSSNIWNNLSLSFNAGGDTIVISSAAGGPFSVRVQSRTGDCFPAFSTPVQVNVRCATPFLVPNSSVYISQVKLSSINNFSETNPKGGSVQDFTSQSTTLCKGATYPLGIKASADGAKLLAWADFNQDGDFADADENLLNGTLSSTLLQEYSVQIPASAATGNCRLRIVVVSAESNVSDNPCAAGPYLSGEIEEYNLNITTGTVAEAGADQLVGCPGTASLNGNSPGSGTGLWSLIEGSGLIANPGSASTTVNNLGSGINVFRWTVNNACGNTSDEVNINFPVFNPIELGNDTTICPPSTISLGGPVSGISSYLWSDGSTGNSLVISSAGTYWLQVQTSEGCTFRDSILVDPCVSIPVLPLKADYSLLPNPFNGPVSLRQTGGENSSVVISWLDAFGRILREDFTAIGPGLNHLKMPSGLAGGLYLLRISESGKMPVQIRLVKE